MSTDEKVLLVEDDVLVATLVVDALEELGYRTVEVTTAKAALDIVNGDAKLVFAVIDVGLPDGRGDALAAELRRIRPGLPIIIATGYGEAHLDESLRATAQTAVLSKPYDIGQLQAAIRAVTEPPVPQQAKP